MRCDPSLVTDSGFSTLAGEQLSSEQPQSNLSSTTTDTSHRSDSPSTSERNTVVHKRERQRAEQPPFTCALETCGKELKDRKTKERHEAIHRGDRLTCLRCNKSFGSRLDNFKRHMHRLCKRKDDT
ncbi:hypothetical protein GQ53DRAFT_441272 [Thozetella sp. PMI_491]|nr:hypothetical protein GQ53DRAFT_441272 [Thozetella sp. PMI_491]